MDRLFPGHVAAAGIRFPDGIGTWNASKGFGKALISRRPM
jgi:hypothetical protein